MTKRPLIAGTMLLTLAGLFSRILGFFYRIFLSRTIGAEGLGIYQMIFPIHGIAFALCAGPIQTSISRLTAASPEQDLTYLPGVTRNKAGELSGASLVSFEHMQTLQTVVETVIKEAATALYSGQADRIPDGKSCRYCVFFTSCPLAEKSAF